MAWDLGYLVGINQNSIPVSYVQYNWLKSYGWSNVVTVDQTETSRYPSGVLFSHNTTTNLSGFIIIIDKQVQTMQMTHIELRRITSKEELRKSSISKSSGVNSRDEKCEVNTAQAPAVLTVPHLCRESRVKLFPPWRRTPVDFFEKCVFFPRKRGLWTEDVTDTTVLNWIWP